jgi:hypothetical protein
MCNFPRIISLYEISCVLPMIHTIPINIWIRVTIILFPYNSKKIKSNVSISLTHIDAITIFIYRFYLVTHIAIQIFLTHLLITYIFK